MTFGQGCRGYQRAQQHRPAEQPMLLMPGDYITYPGDAPHILRALVPDTTAVMIMEHV